MCIYIYTKIDDHQIFRILDLIRHGTFSPGRGGGHDCPRNEIIRKCVALLLTCLQLLRSESDHVVILKYYFPSTRVF